MSRVLQRSFRGFGFEGVDAHSVLMLSGVERDQDTSFPKRNVLLMVYILHYLKDPKLWELWYIPYSG